MFKRPYIADTGTEIALGLALVVAGFVLLYDAYDGRGRQKPRILGPFLPW